MATITTKYDVGDRVFHATSYRTNVKLPCPDCLGQKKWQAISPAGRGYLFDCPRCAVMFQSDRNLSLSREQHVAVVTPLTIGSVGLRNYGEQTPEYMCRETGVGSGSVYAEADLFETHEEAVAAANAKAAAGNERLAENPALFTGNLKVAYYQIDMASADAAKRETRDLRYSVEYLVQDILDLFDGEWRGPPKLDEVVEIMRKHVPSCVPEDAEVA